MIKHFLYVIALLTCFPANMEGMQKFWDGLKFLNKKLNPSFDPVNYSSGAPSKEICTAINRYLDTTPVAPQLDSSTVHLLDQIRSRHTEYSLEMTRLFAAGERDQAIKFDQGTPPEIKDNCIFEKLILGARIYGVLVAFEAYALKSAEPESKWDLLQKLQKERAAFLKKMQEDHEKKCKVMAYFIENTFDQLESLIDPNPRTPLSFAPAKKGPEFSLLVPPASDSAANPPSVPSLQDRLAAATVSTALAPATLQMPTDKKENKEKK